MLQKLNPAERLIVAADFEPDETGVEGLKRKVIALAVELADIGVYFKVETVLRACGYDLIDALHAHNIKVFADLKLSGIPQTLKHDGMLLGPHRPELVTAMAPTGIKSMAALKEALQDSELLAVTLLSSMKKTDASRLFGSADENDAVLTFAFEAENAGFDGLVSAPAELPMLVKHFGGKLTLNTPNIRPGLAIIGDDQNRERSMTPYAAIEAGATRLVVGRPIIQAKDRRAAALQIINEISSASS